MKIPGIIILKGFRYPREPFIYSWFYKILLASIFPLFSFSLLLTVPSCKEEPENPPADLQLISIRIGNTDLNLSDGEKNKDIPFDENIGITLSSPVNTETIERSIQLLLNENTVAAGYTTDNNDKTILIEPVENLQNLQEYSVIISNQLKGVAGEGFRGYQITFTTAPGLLTIVSIKIGDTTFPASGRLTEVPLNAGVTVSFSAPVNPNTVTGQTLFVQGLKKTISFNYSFSDQNTKIMASPVGNYEDLSRQYLQITSGIKGENQEIFESYSGSFYTVADPAPKFPVITDDELLTLVQQQTFRYFWDFGHPVSGLSRERNSSGNTVTSGGSGFGLMAILVGIERGFISREEGVSRITTIVNFLAQADRFHGAWSHWLNGETGKAIPFSTQDDGGDLVETSYLSMGLLTARQYLEPGTPAENELIENINTLWESIEWNWYTRDGQKTLYWHWSPNYGWAMNMQIKGFNEALITYVMAASSPTHGIDLDTYTMGWTNSSYFINGKTFYGYTLPLGFDYGGPLFFAHYSFLGIDPNGLSDFYADYWSQNVNHTLINREHCIRNPGKWVGYSEECWGLTASDNPSGYSAHSPTNDLGVITPTAAISSLPYTPDYSMEAIRFFYYTLGDRLWGEYGFYDAFNISEGWTADSYLAIDQGPIIIMIENHRTGLIWDLFMSCPEVQEGLDLLGFSHK